MDGAIRLPKIGYVRAVIHRLPQTDWILKTVTISQESDGSYYVFGAVFSLKTGF